MWNFATVPFWGAVIPLSLIFGATTKNHPFWLGVAGLMIFLGVFGVRLNIIIPPLTQEPLPGYVAAYHSVRIASFYFPNILEWLISFAAVALGCLLFYLGIKIFPLQEKSCGEMSREKIKNEE